MKKKHLLSMLLLASINGNSYAKDQAIYDDIYIPGFDNDYLESNTNPVAIQSSIDNFTALPYDYKSVVDKSQRSIENLLHQTQAIANLNQLVLHSSQYFKDKPYAISGAEGEGNWCNSKQKNCLHIQQDPTYRTDQFNCQTLVQTILGMVNAKTLKQFENNILKVEYGAAGENYQSIHYYNRNNFASGDFNPINQANGLLADITAKEPFQKIFKTTNALIDRQQWFEYQQKPKIIKNNVRVIDYKDGITMYKLFSDNYPKEFHQFLLENVAINYLPKESLVNKVINKNQISYIPNKDLINKIATPSVIEIVRNVKKWNIGNKNIKDLIGTELNVSHMGLVYKQNFKKGDVIYQKITCDKDAQGKKVCNVKPVICNEAQGCHEVMFLDATDAYPNGYFYYKDKEGSYHCTAEKPIENTIPYTTCNRVMALPLGDYLATYQYDSYIFMDSPSIVGINIQKLTFSAKALKQSFATQKGNQGLTNG